MPTFAASIQQGTGSFCQSNQARKIKIKGIQNRKEEVKLSLFIYRKSKKNTHKLLQLINTAKLQDQHKNQL